MSDKKRRRIGENKVDMQTLELVETVQNSVDATLEKKEEENSDPFAEFYDENGEFQWDAYTADCPKTIRTHNPHVKVQGNDKVFSREPYAQEMYDILAATSQEIKPNIFVGEIHEGVVFGVTADQITVDVGYREMVYVKLSKEGEDVRLLTPGEETAVLITETKGTLTGTITGGVRQKTFMDLRAGIEEGNTAWIGTVKNMIENGGYIVKVQGVDCFMPGSLAGINKLANFDSIVGEEIYVVPVSFSPDRGTIVVSHRKYLQALIPQAISELKENIGIKKAGAVTGTAKYGVFVEFDKCLTGMIHSNELDEETLAKFRAREIKPGDPVEFFVKDIISNTKITLTQKEASTINPWDNITERYQIPSTVKATVKTKKEYGIFVNIEEGITGLLHVSELPDGLLDTFKPGDEINVQITRIEEATMKVFLKLPQ